MGTFKLSQEASEDLWRIYQWGVNNHGLERADQYYNDFFDHFELLAQHPDLYPEVNDLRQGYRKSLCGVDTVYYRLVGDVVEIMAILRKQDRDQWL